MSPITPPPLVEAAQAVADWWALNEHAPVPHRLQVALIVALEAWHIGTSLPGSTS